MARAHAVVCPRVTQGWVVQSTRDERVHRRGEGQVRSRLPGQPEEARLAFGGAQDGREGADKRGFGSVGIYGQRKPTRHLRNEEED